MADRLFGRRGILAPEHGADTAAALPLAGTGLPVTDDLVFTYDRGDGTLANGINVGTTHNPDGSFSVTANVGELLPGETTVDATLTARDAGGAVDPEVTATAYAIELAVAPNPVM